MPPGANLPLPPAQQPTAPAIPYTGDRTQVQLDSDRIIAHGSLPDTTAVLLYTVPDQTSVEIREWWFSNSDGVAARTVSIYIVAPGDSAASTNIFIPAFSIPLAEYSILQSRTALEPGWSIWGVADDGDKVNYHISGVEAVR